MDAGRLDARACPDGRARCPRQHDLHAYARAGALVAQRPAEGEDERLGASVDAIQEFRCHTDEEAMLTIVPRPRATKAVTAAEVRRVSAATFNAIMSSIVSMSACSSGALEPTPALLTSSQSLQTRGPSVEGHAGPPACCQRPRRLRHPRAAPGHPRRTTAVAPVVAVLRSQLVARFHGRFLRVVSENSGSSQSLLGACVQAILLSRNRGLANVTLSRYVPLLNAPEHL